MNIKWYKIANLASDRFKDVTTGSGIYFVRFAKNRTPINIGRLGGVDPEGILYVGSTKNLTRRIRRLWRAINGDGDAHTIGKTIIFCKISETISPSDYEISWEELENVKEARGQEGAALKDYSDKYKEPPPLNLGIRREYFFIWGIAKWGRSHWAYETDDFVKSIIKL